MYDTMIFGVLYEGVEKFRDDFIDSIKQQTDQYFLLVLFNDTNDESLKKYFPQETIWLKSDKNLTPVEIRSAGIMYGESNKIRNIIFVDLDDYFSSTKVHRIKETLREYEFAFTELTLVDEQGIVQCEHALQTIGVMQSELTNPNELVDRNIVGLSHSGARICSISKIEIPGDIIAFDWWLYSILLLNSQKGYFIRDCTTFYRQHVNNLVGMKKMLDDASLRRGVNVKSAHYKNLALYCMQKGDNEKYRLYSRRLFEMELLSESLNTGNYQEKYLSIINRNMDKIYKGWWSEIISAEELQRYA